MTSTIATFHAANMKRLNKPEWINTAPRIAQEKAGRIRTFTGRYVNPLAMRARDVCIEDIAHHLSLITRYTGACPHHYSVGQHSIICMERSEAAGHSLPLQLAHLLHDAPEYVLNDIASPVKYDPRMKWYRDLDHDLGKLVLCVFGLDPDLLALTKPIDDAVFREECATFYGKGPRIITPWTDPKDTERIFLMNFYRLHGVLQ
jgi:hypothetical protein